MDASILLICLLIGLAIAAVAQAGRGSINGLVTDQTGNRAGMRVGAQSPAIGVKLARFFSAADLYSFVSLAPGNYQITASAKGFETLGN